MPSFMHVLFYHSRRSTTKDDIVEELSLQKQDSDEIYTALLTPEDHYQELNVPTITPQISAGTTSTSTTAASSASTSLPISKTLKDNNSFISKTEHNITTASMPSLNSSKVANGNGNYLTLTGKTFLTASNSRRSYVKDACCYTLCFIYDSPSGGSILSYKAVLMH